MINYANEGHTIEAEQRAPVRMFPNKKDRNYHRRVMVRPGGEAAHLIASSIQLGRTATATWK